MIQHPAVIALTASSVAVSLMLLYAGWYGMKILRDWEPGSGSERQLWLERRTYLVSTLVGYALVFQILSLLLYIYTADELHSLFTGAMCAAGTLNADGYGYPTLALKVAGCILAGVWLVINHADTRGYDYPLIKVKYALLALLAPVVVVEAYLQFKFFSGLKGDLITSCCGSLFSSDRPGIAGDIAGLPPGAMLYAFYAVAAMTFIAGLVFYMEGRGGYLFSLLSAILFLAGAAALISSFCLYFYELPTHHCPFCILQREYGYAGYALYAALLGGVVAGTGAGALMPSRKKGSLLKAVPALQRRLAGAALLCYLVFTLIVTYRMLSTPFTAGV